MLLNEKTYKLVLLTILICCPIVLIHCHGCAGYGSGGQTCRGGDHGCDAMVLVAVCCCCCAKGPPSGHVADTVLFRLVTCPNGLCAILEVYKASFFIFLSLR